MPPDPLALAILFLSTLSLRRATGRIPRLRQPAGNFYPRSPCGERHRAENSMLPPFNFYPRSPCGERPWVKSQVDVDLDISIHALLAESDRCQSVYRKRVSNDFYPRSPCGERLLDTREVIPWQRFLSTLSLRRATAALLASLNAQLISIHALLAESD